MDHNPITYKSLLNLVKQNKITKDFLTNQWKQIQKQVKSTKSKQEIYKSYAILSFLLYHLQNNPNPNPNNLNPSISNNDSMFAQIYLYLADLQRYLSLKSCIYLYNKSLDYENSGIVFNNLAVFSKNKKDVVYFYLRAFYAEVEFERSWSNLEKFIENMRGKSKGLEVKEESIKGTTDFSWLCVGNEKGFKPLISLICLYEQGVCLEERILNFEVDNFLEKKVLLLFCICKKKFIQLDWLKSEINEKVENIKEKDVLLSEIEFKLLKGFKPFKEIENSYKVCFNVSEEEMFYSVLLVYNKYKEIYQQEKQEVHEVEDDEVVFTGRKKKTTTTNNKNNLTRFSSEFKPEEDDEIITTTSLNRKRNFDLFAAVGSGRQSSNNDYDFNREKAFGYFNAFRMDD